MKNKKIFKTLSALCAALVLMMGLSVTAFAQGTEELPAEDATNDSNVVVEETEDSPALTPDGNAALVDDFGDNNLYQQQAAAKEEIGKPFPFEDDLRVKSARLVELDTLLNIDGKGHAQPETVVAKSARPSVLDSLKRPVPPRSPEKKPKQHEEVR